MDNKKIAIYHNLPPGGGLRTITEFAKRLSKKYEIDLYTIEGNTYSLEEKVHFANVFSYKLNGLSLITGGFLLKLQEDFNFFFKLPQLHRRIANDIDRRRYKLVLISHDKNIQSPYVIKFLKTKNIYYCQEPWRKYYEYNLNSLNKKRMSFKKVFLLFSDSLKKNIDIGNARSSTIILSNSYSSNESIYRAYGVYSYVCHLGVDVDNFRSRNTKRKNYIYTVGNLSAHKGHKFVIDSLSLVKKSIRPLLVISSGGIDLDNANELIRYGQKKGVKVKIIGKVSTKEMIRLYSEAKATICAAHLETLGLSALESISCGTPVIAVREGGYRDILINEENGFLVDRDELKLAQVIERIFSGKFSLNEMVINARITLIPYWTWESATKRFESFIEKITGK